MKKITIQRHRCKTKFMYLSCTVSRFRTCVLSNGSFHRSILMQFFSDIQLADFTFYITYHQYHTYPLTPSECFLIAMRNQRTSTVRDHSDRSTQAQAAMQFFASTLNTSPMQSLLVIPGFFKAQLFEFFYFLLFGASLGPKYFPSPRLAFYEVIGKNGVQSGNVMSCCRCSNGELRRISG